MKQYSVLIISESESDRSQLSSCLNRAAPARFNVSTQDCFQQPLDALLYAPVDAVIMAHGPETDYLLRLARKNETTVPIILLLDETSGESGVQLKADGAQDYLLRGQLADELVHRVVDYSIQMKKAREEIRKLSSRDPLTGALNRASFRAHLERAMERSHRYGFDTALLYVNIDQFATINDQYGEADGDLMIRMISRRLVNNMRSTDSIARLGGDEFAVVLEDVRSVSDVEVIASKMLRSVSAPMDLSDQQVTVDASIGVAIYPEDGQKFSNLVESARSAMQQAKLVPGSKFIRYSDQLAFDVSGSNSLAAELRAAIRNNQLELHYQPRVNLATGRTECLEALLRWNHPERGLLSPAEFLPACEDMGLMRTIGYQIIQGACSALNWLRGENLPHICVAINISFSQIQDDRFVEVVKSIIGQNGANASQLEFELTESAILQNPAVVKNRMDELGSIGISFSLDDFGTGYSQLSHLTELPISALKIDASFTRDLPHNHHQGAICSMIIGLAQRLGITVVAEGAETYEQVEFLRAQQCEQVQGYYYSPAFPLHQLPRFIYDQKSRQHDQLLC